MIGIVLNMSCNVENEAVSKYMIEKDVIKMLLRILVDER